MSEAVLAARAIGPEAPPVSILLACPAGEMVHTRFYECAMELAGYTMSMGRGITIRQMTAQGSILPDLRSRLVAAALQCSATHMLTIDSDMMFPHDSLLRLLAHDKDIVGANYPMKTTPARPTSEALDGTPLHTRFADTGLVEATYLATGLLLIKTDVFRKMPIPWFQTLYLDEHKAYMTEDVFFCLKAREHGYRIWCDQDLSKEVCHVGQKWFRMSDVPGWDGEGRPAE